jgi:diguanylate cyclase (GGDEF)-like protein
MQPSVSTVLAVFAAQAAGAAVLASLLLHFHRRYRQPFLWHWTLSWFAFAAYLLSATAAVTLLRAAPGSPPRLAVAFAQVLASLLQAYWLVLGARELRTGRPAEGRPRLMIPLAIGVAAVAALAWAFDTSAAAAEGRHVMRVGVRSGLVAAAFFWATRQVWLARPGGRAGTRLVSGAFLLFALAQTHYFVLTVGRAVSGWAPTYGAWMGFVDLVVQWVMGLGMVVCLLEDEREVAREAAEQVEHLALHDTLTGLPNRALFGQRLRKALGAAEREGRPAAVMVLDVDRFKLVNDSLGHRAGDALLEEVARRLAAVVRDGDTLARAGGDEFILLFPELRREEDAGRISAKLLEAVRQPVEVDGRELLVTASVGIALFPGDGRDGDGLVQKADAAMYRAKELGGDGVQLASPALIARAAEQLAMEGALRRALARREFVLHYQPIYETRTGRLVGTEALIRWLHPQRGLLRPAEFFRLMGPTGMTGPTGLWVLATACAQTRRWQQAGHGDLFVSVNLSPHQFTDPALVEQVSTALEEAGLLPECLALEITENAAMENAEVSLHTLRGLKALGVRISLDDFGTGYSSFSYLKRFPVDLIKVDRSLVADVHRDRGDAAIVATVVDLARNLGMRVVAEGVEDEAQLTVVRDAGCDFVQGYLLGRPMPAAEMEEALRRAPVPPRAARA